MPVLTFPDVFPQTESWSYIARTQSFASELTGQEQFAELPGSVWSASLNYTRLSRAQGRKLLAFIASLKGRVGKCYVVPYDARLTQGNPTGSPIVSAGAQAGDSLNTSGWAPSTEVLKAGDYFEVNGELKLITQDVVSGSDGLATLNFVPDLQSSPPNGSQIITTNPKCIMRLANDSQATMQLSQDKYYSVNLQFVEAI